MKKAVEYINQTVEVRIDRPMGSLHPDHSDLLHPLNYGFVPGTIAPDGEEIDAYLLGVFQPVDRFKGRCIAVICREDGDDKLIVVPEGKSYSDEQIHALTEFQERFFDSRIVRVARH